jgi:type II secretion system protein G
MAYCAYCGAQVREATYAPCPHCGRAANGAPQPVRPIAAPAGSSGASTVILILVGVFVVIGFIGILAAIAIPNLLTAMQRSKQKRTMADMRSLSLAIDSYKTDHNGVLPSGDDASSLRSQLSPTYIRTVPVQDGWTHPFHYAHAVSGEEQHYTLASAGKDGLLENDDLTAYSHGSTTNFDCDIVYRDGEFVQAPQGVQHQ